MTKKSKEQILREIETAIQRLDKEGLPDSEIIDILASKGVPADRAEALLIKRRTERRNSLLGSGVGALLFGVMLMVIVVNTLLRINPRSFCRTLALTRTDSGQYNVKTHVDRRRTPDTNLDDGDGCSD